MMPATPMTPVKVDSVAGRWAMGVISAMRGDEDRPGKPGGQRDEGARVRRTELQALVHTASKQSPNGLSDIRFLWCRVDDDATLGHDRPGPRHAAGALVRSRSLLAAVYQRDDGGEALLDLGGPREGHQGQRWPELLPDDGVRVAELPQPVLAVDPTEA